MYCISQSCNDRFSGLLDVRETGRSHVTDISVNVSGTTDNGNPNTQPGGERQLVDIVGEGNKQEERLVIILNPLSLLKL